MSIEILVLGIEGASALLAAGCVALLGMTLRNLKGTEVLGNSILKTSNAHTDKIFNSVQFLESELRKVSPSVLRGNLKLIAELGLPNDVQPTVLVEGEHLSSTAASIGFSNLQLVADEILKRHSDRDPYFFGVNRGGGLLANLLSQRLGLDQKHLVRCDYRSDWKRVLCEPRRGVTLAIIVDDAIRTGETIAAVRNEISLAYPDAKIFVLGLVISASKKVFNTKIFEIVDYYSWVSLQQGTKLPWTDKASDEATDYIEQDGVNQVLARLVAHSSADNNDQHDHLQTN